MVGKNKVNICHLYSKEMNIYGDTGNVLALKWRLEERGYSVSINKCGVGDKINSQTDIIVAGGGQDSGQFKIASDLIDRKKELRALHDDGVVIFAVCGMYQLLGNSFKTENGEIEGVSIFDADTVAGNTRLIGNVSADSQWGRLVGFENHSGRTYLGDENQSMSRITKGAGNNGEDYSEGCVSKNAFGTYLHGPAFPKNPRLADEILTRALERKTGKSVQLAQIDDSYAVVASEIANKLPR